MGAESFRVLVARARAQPTLTLASASLFFLLRSSSPFRPSREPRDTSTRTSIVAARVRAAYVIIVH